MNPKNNPRKYIGSSSPQPGGRRDLSRDRQVTTELLLQQINSIYENDPDSTTTAKPTKQADSRRLEPVRQPKQSAYYQKPATKTIAPGPGAIALDDAPKIEAKSSTAPTDQPKSYQVDSESLKKYHSAWQDYYQKYYERYYLTDNQPSLATIKPSSAGAAPTSYIATDSGDEITNLRDKIRHQVGEKVGKVRRSRHFWPIAAASLVMLLFVFLQYNRMIFAVVEAYVVPGERDAAPLIIDPNAAGMVSDEPRLIIPKINVNVPIVWSANAADQNSLNAAMDKGVVWFNILGANARPGEIGNFVLSGHSSNDWLDSGDYKFIFVRLEQMADGDTFYVDYEDTRYTYVVTHREVVQPTDVAALTKPTDKPIITLVTCTPLGTDLNRLLVFAEQVSPDPSHAHKPTKKTETTATEMPSNSPTFLERVFGQ